jgi:3-hydroxyisobutyrate dehydrogenase-like beta-hydroxyacid dehydrogenase
MAKVTVAILHPGEMGAAVGACVRRTGARAVWASAGRSAATAARAVAAGLIDLGPLGAALGASDVALSICPPHGAMALARAVAGHGFQGLYVDANAVSPATARAIGQVVGAAGAAYVDGGIVGPPPGAATGSGTRLYLAGEASAAAAALFEGTAVETVVLDGPIGSASALKACYAAWNKGASALVAGVAALAVHAGVDQALWAEWQRSQADAWRRLDGVRASARKAWRWIAEMEEIGAAFAAAGLPDGFGRAAAELYGRLAPYKDTPVQPSIEDVCRALGTASPPTSRPTPA